MASIAQLWVEFRAATDQFASDMNVVQKEVREFDKILKPIKEAAEDVGRTLTATLTVPILGLATAAETAAIKMDESMDDIRAATGATGDALESLGESFRTVLGQVPNTVGDVTKAIDELVQRTGLTGAPLEELAVQELNLSRITHTDLAENVAATTRLFGDWSVATQDQGQALDFLFKTTQQTGIPLTRLTELVVQFGAPMRALGFDLEHSAAMLGKWEKEGVNMETVLSGLRFALGNFAKAGLDPQAALQAVIEKIQNAKTESEATGIAFQVFGKRAAVDMSRAIIEGRFNIDELVNSINNSHDTINRAAFDTLSFADKLDVLKHQAMIALAPLGASMLNALERMMPAITQLLGYITSLANAFANLSPGAQEVIMIIAGAAAAIGPALLIFSKIAGTLTGLYGIFEYVAGAIGGFVGEAVAILGLGPVAGILAAVAAAAYLIYTNWDAVKTSLIGIWDAIKAAAMEIWLPLVSFFTDIVEQIIAAWNSSGGAIMDVFSVINSGIRAAFGILADIVTEAIRLIGSLISGGLEVLHGVFDVWTGIITLNWARVWEGLKLIVTGFWTELKAIVTAGVAILLDILSNLLSYWSSVFIKLGQHVPGAGAVLVALGDDLKGLSMKAAEVSDSLHKTATAAQAAGDIAAASVPSHDAAGASLTKTGAAAKGLGIDLSALTGHHKTAADAAMKLKEQEDRLVESFENSLEPSFELSNKLESLRKHFSDSDIVNIYAKQIVEAADATRKHGYEVHGATAELEEYARQILGGSAAIYNLATALNYISNTPPIPLKDKLPEITDVPLLPPGMGIDEIPLGAHPVGFPPNFGKIPSASTKEFDDLLKKWTQDGQAAVNQIVGDISRMFTESIIHGKNFWEAFKSQGTNILVSFFDTFQTKLLHSFLDPLATAIGRVMDTLVERVHDLFEGALGGLFKSFGEKLGGLLGIGESAAGGAAGTAGSAAGDIPGVGGAGGVAGTAGGAFAGIGTGIISGVLSGAISAIGSMRQEGTLNAIEESTRYFKIDQEIIINEFWWPILGILQRGEEWWHQIAMELDAIFTMITSPGIPAVAGLGIAAPGGGTTVNGPAVFNINLHTEMTNSFAEHLTAQEIKTNVMPVMMDMWETGQGSYAEKLVQIINSIQGGAVSTKVSTG